MVVANGFGDRFEKLQSEPGPVLGGHSTLAYPLVGHTSKELVFQASIWSTEHNAIKSGLGHGDFTRAI